MSTVTNSPTATVGSAGSNQMSKSPDATGPLANTASIVIQIKLREIAIVFNLLNRARHADHSDHELSRQCPVRTTDPWFINRFAQIGALKRTLRFSSHCIHPITGGRRRLWCVKRHKPQPGVAARR
jgi:hypothetical protein